MINKLLTNPFYIYVISGLLIIFLYQLGWSIIFPDLSLELLVFFCISFIIAIGFGMFFQKGGIKYYPYKNSFNYKPTFITWLIIGLFIIDYLYIGFLPISRPDLYNLKVGAPGIHVLLLSISAFHGVTLFYIYLSNKSKLVLIQYLLILFIQILLMRRSNFLWISLASFILFLQKSKPIGLIKIAKYLLICILLINVLFGIFGNYRNHLAKNHAIKYMGASDKFIKTGLDNSFYMFYLYAASPIANLQSNINIDHSECNISDFFDFIIVNTFPESLKNRLISSLDITPRHTKTVMEVLNVSTIYSSSYSYLGWIGTAIIFLYFLANIFFVYIISPAGTTFHVVVNALLCCSVVFCWFDNVFHLITTVLIIFIFPLLYRFYISFRNKTVIKLIM